MTRPTHPFSTAVRSLLGVLSSSRLLFALALFLGLLFLLVGRGFRVQTSESGPRGIWQFRSGLIERGSWVAICPPHDVAQLAIERRYVPSGPCAGNVAPLLKKVIALPGDTVELGPAGIAVRGVLVPRTAVRAVDRQGRPMPHPGWGVRRVEAGMYWVANERADSFDSRYFGPIDATRVLSLAEAVLVEGDEP